MTDWIEHNGGPQPVDDETWVEVQLRSRGKMSPSPAFKYGSCWNHQGAGPLGRADIVEYRILNQHLINEKQAEIDKLYAFLKQMREWDQMNPPISGDHKNFADQIDKILNK